MPVREVRVVCGMPRGRALYLKMLAMLDGVLVLSLPQLFIVQ